MTRVTPAVPSLQIAAIVALSAVGAIMPLGAPAMAGVLMKDFNLSPVQAGTYFTIELGCGSLASLPALWWLPRVSMRRALYAAVVLYILANVASYMTHDYHVLLLCRAIGSLGMGTIMVLTMTLAGHMARKEFVFGLWVSGQLLLSAIVIMLFPWLDVHGGIGAIYLSVAFLMLLAGLLAPAFPDIPVPERTKPTTILHEGSRTGSVMRIMGVLLFYLAIGGIWTFMERIGAQANPNPVGVDAALAIAALFGIAGGMTASFASMRLKGAGRLMLGGYAVLAVSLCMLLNAPASARFVMAAVLFKFAWTFTVPFVLGRVAQANASRLTMALVNLTIGGGFAFGPPISGYVIEAAGMTPLLLLAGAALIVSFLFICNPAMQGRRQEYTA
ncbi:MFS transporter [Komagataeibacter sp. FXV2]|nr:MFS transporter [Komagataeibacter sp. FXV2]